MSFYSLTEIPASMRKDLWDEVVAFLWILLTEFVFLSCFRLDILAPYYFISIKSLNLTNRHKKSLKLKYQS